MPDVYTSQTVAGVFVKVQGGFKEVTDYLDRTGPVRTWTELLPVNYRETVDTEELRSIAAGNVPLHYTIIPEVTEEQMVKLRNYKGMDL